MSVNQIRSQGHTVDDVPIWYGGKQAIFIKGEDIGIPLAYMGALMYLPIRRPTRKELTEGIVFNLTDGVIEWDPQKYETQDNLELWDNNRSNFFNFNIRVNNMHVGTEIMDLGLSQIWNNEPNTDISTPKKVSWTESSHEWGSRRYYKYISSKHISGIWMYTKVF